MTEGWNKYAYNLYFYGLKNLLYLWTKICNPVFSESMNSMLLLVSNSIFIQFALKQG